MIDFTTNDSEDIAIALIAGHKLTTSQIKRLEDIRCNPQKVCEFNELVNFWKELSHIIDSETDDVNSSNVDEELLAAYLDGSLNKSDRDKVDRLLVQNRQARHCFYNLYTVLKDAGCLASQLNNRLDYYIQLGRKGLRLLFHPEDGFMQLSSCPAQVLGSHRDDDGEDNSKEWTQQIGGVSFVFRIVHVAIDKIHLYLKAAENKSFQLSVYQSGTLIQSEAILEGEQVVLENLTGGLYLFEITFSEQIPVSFSLNIDASE